MTEHLTEQCLAQVLCPGCDKALARVFQGHGGRLSVKHRRPGVALRPERYVQDRRWYPSGAPLRYSSGDVGWECACADIAGCNARSVVEVPHVR